MICGQWLQTFFQKIRAIEQWAYFTTASMIIRKNPFPLVSVPASIFPSGVIMSAEIVNRTAHSAEGNLFIAKVYS